MLFASFLNLGQATANYTNNPSDIQYGQALILDSNEEHPCQEASTEERIFNKDIYFNQDFGIKPQLAYSILSSESYNYEHFKITLFNQAIQSDHFTIQVVCSDQPLIFNVAISYIATTLSDLKVLWHSPNLTGTPVNSGNGLRHYEYIVNLPEFYEPGHAPTLIPLLYSYDIVVDEDTDLNYNYYISDVTETNYKVNIDADGTSKILSLGLGVLVLRDNVNNYQFQIGNANMVTESNSFSINLPDLTSEYSYGNLPLFISLTGIKIDYSDQEGYFGYTIKVNDLFQSQSKAQYHLEFSSQSIEDPNISQQMLLKPCYVIIKPVAITWRKDINLIQTGKVVLFSEGGSHVCEDGTLVSRTVIKSVTFAKAFTSIPQVMISQSLFNGKSTTVFYAKMIVTNINQQGFDIETTCHYQAFVLSAEVYYLATTISSIEIGFYNFNAAGTDLTSGNGYRNAQQVVSLSKKYSYNPSVFLFQAGYYYTVPTGTPVSYFFSAQEVNKENFKISLTVGHNTSINEMNFFYLVLRRGTTLYSFDSGYQGYYYANKATQNLYDNGVGVPIIASFIDVLQDSVQDSGYNSYSFGYTYQMPQNNYLFNFLAPHTTTQNMQVIVQWVALQLYPVTYTNDPKLIQSNSVLLFDVNTPGNTCKNAVITPRSFTVTVNFVTAFDEIPKVVLGIIKVEGSTSLDQSIRLTTQNIITTGFEVFVYCEFQEQVKEVHINYLATTFDDVETGILNANTAIADVNGGFGIRNSTVQQLLTGSYISPPAVQIFIAGYFYHETQGNDIKLKVEVQSVTTNDFTCLIIVDGTTTVQFLQIYYIALQSESAYYSLAKGNIEMSTFSQFESVSITQLSDGGSARNFMAAFNGFLLQNDTGDYKFQFGCTYGSSSYNCLIQNLVASKKLQGSVNWLVLMVKLVSCDFKCSLCNPATPNICYSCRGDRQIGCACPVGYYDDNFNINCQECHPTCQQCSANGCIQCNYNRIPISPNDMACQCPLGSVTHTFTEVCTDCDWVAYKSEISSDYLSLLLTFQVILEVPEYPKPLTDFNTDLCSFIFNDDSVNKLGANPLCQISGAIITIYFGQQSTYELTDFMIIRLGVLRKPGCPGQFNNYFTQRSDIPINIPSPEVDLNVPQVAVSTCLPQTISISGIRYDANSGLYNIQWFIDSVTPTNNNHKANLQKILDTFKNSQVIYLDVGNILSGTVYTFSLTFENKFKSTGFKNFTLTTAAGGASNVDLKITNLAESYAGIYPIKLTAEAMLSSCSGAGLSIIKEAIQMTWYEKQPDTTFLQKRQNDVNDLNQDTYVIPEYTLPFNQDKTYKVVASSKVNPATTSEYIFTIKIDKAETQVYIEGGNRQQGYGSITNIVGIARDYSQTPANQESGFTYIYTCLNLNKNAVCEDAKGNNVALNTTQNQTFRPRFFLPYNAYEFTFSATKGGVTKQAKSILIVIELDLPELLVNYPQQLITQKVNLNDMITLNVNYSKNPDEVFYALAIFYDYEQVANKKFNFKTFRFQMWDLYDKFVPTKQDAILRVIVYDPIYFMPLTNSIKIKINTAPYNGKIQIKPSLGNSMDTEFTINAKGFVDSDLPFYYSFYLYLNKQEYDLERKAGINPNKIQKNLIQDTSSSSIAKTMLPQGNPTDLNSVLILVSISDGLGAITNQTISLPVAQSNQLTNRNQYLTAIKTKLTASLALKNPVDKALDLNMFALEVSNFDSYGCPCIPTDTTCNNEWKPCNQKGTCSVKGGSCTCNPGFLLRDCSTNTQADITLLTQIKKSIYSGLISVKTDIYNQNILNQIIKSQQLIIADLEVSKQFTMGEVTQMINDLNILVIDLINQIIQINAQNLELIIDVDAQTQQKKINSILGKINKNINSVIKTVISNVVLSAVEKDICQKQIITIIDTIQLAFQTSSLPNEDQQAFFGDEIIQTSFVATPKFVLETLFEYSVSSSNANNVFQQAQQAIVGGNLKVDKFDAGSDNKTQIYDIGSQFYKQNPYKTDVKCPYPDQDTSMQYISISRKESQGSLFRNLASGTTVKPNIEISKPVTMNFNVPSNQNADNSNRVCVQRNEQGNWVSDFCESKLKEIENVLGQKTTTQQCSCKKLSPTFVFNDIKNLYKSSKVQQVFATTEGFEAISNMPWEKSAILYVLIVIFVMYIGGIFHFISMDKLAQYIKCNAVSPSKNETKQTERKTESDRKQESDYVPLKEKEKFIQSLQQQQEDSNKKTSQAQNNMNQVDEKTVNQSQIVQDPNKYVQFAYAKFNILKLGIIDQLVLAFKTYELATIYYREDKGQSRPVRLTFYLFKLIFMLALGALFEKTFDEIGKSTGLSVLIIIFCKIPLVIIRQLTNVARPCALRVIGIILISACNGVCLYAIVAANALNGLDKSNQALLISLYTFLIDTFKTPFTNIITYFIEKFLSTIGVGNLLSYIENTDLRFQLEKIIIKN